MIIKITRGDDPGGLFAYLLGERAALREGARLVGIDNLAAFETAPIEMARVASRSERVRHYVLHVSASPAPGELLSEAQWEAVWAAVDAELGMADHQKVTVEHDDGRPHQHRGYNIVNPDTGRTPPHWQREQDAAHSQRGRRAWDSSLKYRLQRVARDLEEALGLVPASAPERWRSRQRSARPTPGAEKQEQRTGVAPVEVEYGDAIRRALRKRTWKERTDELAAIGIGMESYAGPNVRRRGIVFYVLAEPVRRCSGSALGSDYGLGALERTAGETLAAFLGHRPAPAEAPARIATRAPDPLYARYLAYQAEQKAAREAYHLRRLIAREKQKLEVAEEKRRQQAMRTALRATADRRSRRGVTQRLKPFDQLILDQMRARHRAELAASHPAAPRRLGWADWLEREAQAGDELSRARLDRMRNRARGSRALVSRPRTQGLGR